MTEEEINELERRLITEKMSESRRIYLELTIKEMRNAAEDSG